ncbi:hypothetical protein [Luedemannella helvata]|uniref:Uncharacterized protein n=1 Tax=Luedemannella helvata TaxID=349315 RepID=A0ABN2L8D1_9ACTN
MTPTLLATLLGTLTAGLYAAACWALPFGRCRFCAGKGHYTTWILRRIKACRACKGTGLRLRHGRRAFNYLARIHRDATHTRKAANR